MFAHRQGVLKQASIAMIRVLIADDHAVVRTGLRRLIERQTDWEVVAEAADGEEAIEKAKESKPDVAVLDYSMPRINGIEATRQIRARFPQTEVLIFTVHNEELVVAEVLKAGARGYIAKSASMNDLLAAIELVGRRKPFFSNNVTEMLLKAYVAHPIAKGPTLSEAEMAVVKLVAEGHPNRRIAKILKVSLKTAETCRASAMRKLRLANAAGLVRYAIRHGIVDP
jgi:DNA-binding NarL/FixJ family response regulator